MSENQITILQNEIEIFDEKSENEIMIFEEKKKVKLAAIFTPQGMDKVLDLIEKKAHESKPDIATQKGRDQIKSIAHTVAKCKSPLENIAKHLKADHYKIIDDINEQRDRAVARLDTLRDELRKPVTEIEEREAALLQGRQDQLKKIEDFRHYMGLGNFKTVTEGLESAIKDIRQFMQFDWGDDWAFRAETAANEIIAILEERFAAAKKYEEDQAELAKLKKEAAERAQKDHEAAIAAEAAKKAKFAAEMEAAKKAKAVRDAAEAEQKRAEAEKLKAEEEKRLAEEAKVNAEKRAAEAERLAAEEKFLQKRHSDLFSIGMTQEGNRFVFPQSPDVKFYIYNDEIFAFVGWDKKLATLSKAISDEKEYQRIATEKKAKEDAEKAAADAVKKEQERVAEQKRLDDAAAEKLAANKKHRTKINTEVLIGLLEALDKRGFEHLKNDLDVCDLLKIVLMTISDGEVPHVSIKY